MKHCWKKAALFLFTIKSSHLQILATEMYKIKNDLSSFIVTKLFEQRNEQYYDLRNNPQLTRLPTRTVCHGSESISFLGLKFRTFYQKVNNAISIGAFNIQIKKMEAWKLAVPALQGLCSNGRFCLRKFR